MKKKQEFFGGETITDTILREIRELGESIIIIDQHPSLISLPALGNSHSTISFNLKHRSDVSTIARAILLNKDQEDYFGKLDTGYAIVKLQTRYFNPFLIRIPLIKIDKGIIKDSDIQTLMQSNSAYSALIPQNENKSRVIPLISEPDINKLELTEQALLNDITDFPFASVVERYSRLGLSSRQGTKFQNLLQEKSLIKPVLIFTKTGRIKLLEPTLLAAKLLPRKPISQKQGGLEHRYWINKIAEHFIHKKYKVQKEHRINGAVIDILAQNNKEKIAIEIETGKSDFISNIKKISNYNFTKVISVATNNQAYRNMKQSFKKHKLNINIPHLIKLAKSFS